ncbi:ROK family protein [symbiont of Argiope bruennichi]|uniref:ROK family protein n=1 Tax=symbiont of Argiope bruennichi TaxID=2810479 RepID=UPI003DA371A6
MIIAIDLGGQTTKIGFFEPSGELFYKFICETKIGSVVEHIFFEINNHLKKLNYDFEKDVQAIGFACVGPVDPVNGIAIMAKKINWVNYPILKVVKEIFKKPVYLTNDSRSAIVGEFWKGSAKGYKNVIGYTIGTGVGGGIILNGDIYYGSHNWAGEFGHGGDFQNTFRCFSCGLPHCMEGLSSALATEKYINQYLDKNPNSPLNELRINKPFLKLKDLSQHIAKKDPETIDLLRFCFKPLASHIATMMYAIDPDVVLIGGGPSNLKDDLLEIIYYWVKQLTNEFCWKQIPIKICSLENDAGIYGACYTAIKGYEKEFSKNFS